MDKDLKNKTLEELESLLGELGGKKYHAKYIFSFIHTKDAAEIDEITPLSKDLRAKLREAGYFISRLGLVQKFVDPDETVKFLFEMADGARVESVLMKHRDRQTVCISTQAGCRMGCAFCATGKLRFNRNLTAGEIVDQVNRVAEEEGTVNNVVFMGMGEPMDNYENSMRALHILNHHAGKCIAQRRLTISTCGIPAAIERFADEKLQVHLSVSLHAADDETRAKIMRIGRKYKLRELLASVREYQAKTGRRVMFAYCMIKGVNDSDADAARVIKLLAGLNANVNLIEYNAHAGCDFEASGRDRIGRFMDLLMKAGTETTVRYKRGEEIKAACGQLGATWLEKKGNEAGR